MLFRFSFFLVVFFPVWALGENNGRGTRAIALGNSTVAVVVSPWSVFHNPAGLSEVNGLEASVFVVPQQFGLEELRTIAGAITIPTPFVNVGIGVDQFGFSLYRETGVSVCLARKIDWGISGGITLTGRQFSIERYGSAQVILIDIGLMAEMDERVRLGFVGKNAGSATIGKGKERLPLSADLGISFLPLNNLLLSVSVEKDIRFPASLKIGVEQTLLDAVALRVGFANKPERFSTGVGIRYSMFEFGYAGYSHSFLGWTHQIEIGVAFRD